MTSAEFARKSVDKGISVIPITKDKIPKGAWTKYQTSLMTKEDIRNNFIGDTYVGWVTGYNNLFLLDIDEKYSLPNDSIREKILPKIPTELKKKMLHVRTRSGGDHLWYRIPKESMKTNRPLAKRNTTFEEKSVTYYKEISKGKSEEEAQKIALNDKSRVLIETREQGGMGASYITEGYEVVEGTVGELTEDEHNLIIGLSRRECEYYYPEPEKIDREYISENLWDTYNKTVDFGSLIERNGWEKVGETVDRILYKRPGGTKAKLSANFNKSLRLFKVFSTSTCFETNKGYTPVSVFMMLECNNNSREAYSKLHKEYIDRQEKPE